MSRSSDNFPLLAFGMVLAAQFVGTTDLIFEDAGLAVEWNGSTGGKWSSGFGRFLVDAA
jgi:hypothetical protein